MKAGYRKLKDAVFQCPLVIPSFPIKLQQVAANYLNRSVGIEIECSKKDSYSRVSFLSLGLMNVNTDDTEQRYRFNPGIKGLIEMYKTCELLKEKSLLNPHSGIHYHINCTKEFHLIEAAYNKNDKIFNWVLDELSSWNYTGLYNKRQVSFDKTQVKLHQTYKTIEFRIGEMSFDYNVIVKRAIHATSIVNRMIVCAKLSLK